MSESFSTPTVGSSVTNRTGQEIGSLSEIVFDGATGRPRFALIELASDSTLLVVPWEATSFNPGEHLVLNVTARDLEGVPRFDGYGGSRIAEARWRRNQSAARAAMAVLVMLVLIMGAGLGYLFLHPSASSATEQAERVAVAVRNTTVAVRDGSADTATTMKVKTALALSKRVPASTVSVETRHAVTTLTGVVASLDTKEVAGQIASDTAGVREVRNFLIVDPASAQ